MLHVDIIILMKENYFPNKNLVKEWHRFAYLQISVIPDLIEHNRIFLSAFALNQKMCSWKREENFNSFLYNCGYFSLM